jgi:hypothetical protein
MWRDENVGHQLEPYLPMDSAIAKKHGFVFHKEDAPHIIGEVEGYTYQQPHEMTTLSTDVPLHTSQTSFGKWGLAHYAKTGYDPEEWSDDDGHNAPQVYQYQGKIWVAEGHHRLLADRLTGKESHTVQFTNYD